MAGARRRPEYRIDSDHRYATDLAIRGQIIAKGYVPEDYGPDCVAMCASWVFVRSVARTTRTSTRTDDRSEGRGHFAVCATVARRGGFSGLAGVISLILAFPFFVLPTVLVGILTPVPKSPRNLAHASPERRSALRSY
jgi:hypothetical protein